MSSSALRCGRLLSHRYFGTIQTLALRVLTTGMPNQAYQRLRPLVRIFPAFYRFRHKIKDARLEADRATVNAALDRIEHERQGRVYLVADAFSVADLTAAAMLSPILQPPEVQYPLRLELPAYVQDYRAALLRHPATEWAAAIYRLHRGHSAEVSCGSGPLRSRPPRAAK